MSQRILHLLVLTCGLLASVRNIAAEDAAIPTPKFDGMYVSSRIESKPLRHRVIIRFYPDLTAESATAQVTKGADAPDSQWLFGKHNPHVPKGTYVQTDRHITINVEYEGTKIKFEGIIEDQCLVLTSESTRPNGKLLSLDFRKTRYCYTEWDYQKRLPSDVPAR